MSTGTKQEQEEGPEWLLPLTIFSGTPDCSMHQYF